MSTEKTWYGRKCCYPSPKVTVHSLHFQFELVGSEQDSCEVRRLKWAPPEGDSSHPKVYLSDSEPRIWKEFLQVSLGVSEPSSTEHLQITSGLK